MERIPEPELMNDSDQAEAYAKADFENSNSSFVNIFIEKFPDHPGTGNTLDLGCGPGDIMFRFAREFPQMILHGADGSAEMMLYGKELLQNEQNLQKRIIFFTGFVPGLQLPEKKYSTIISNSLLHHLHNPDGFWQTVSDYSQKGTYIFVMDLRRPANKQEASHIVEEYSAEEPEVLKRDFYNSLLAAFEPEEIKLQLEKAHLGYLNTEIASDRHVIIWGRTQ